MRCDDTRKHLETGGRLDGEAREHLEMCPLCREEHAALLALSGLSPQPSAGLRDRVLAAAPAPAIRWRVAGVAAAVALAAGMGFAGGLAAAPRPTEGPERMVVVRTVERIVEVERKADEKAVTVMAIALERVYQKNVRVDWEGLIATKIHAKPSVKKMIQYCPVAQEMDRISHERPDLVVWEE